MGRRRHHDASSEDEVKILINGNLVVYGEDINALLQYMLLHIPLKHSPIETIKENIEKVGELFMEFCTLKRDTVKGAFRAKVTKAHNDCQRMVQYFATVEDKDVLIRKMHDKLLALEGLGTLRGFGATTKFGDTLYGDPEKISIEKMRGRVV
jgi:hypothetical protein